MASLQQNQLVYALLPATIINQEPTWIKAHTDLVVIGSAGLDGMPRRRISNTKLAFASFAILDSYGYFLKRPSPEHAGTSQVRLFSDGLDWLNQEAILVSSDALAIALNKFTGEKEAASLAKVVRSNPTYESKAYKDFLSYFLPKGMPVQI